MADRDQQDDPGGQRAAHGQRHRATPAGRQPPDAGDVEFLSELHGILLVGRFGRASRDRARHQLLGHCDGTLESGVQGLEDPLCACSTLMVAVWTIVELPSPRIGMKLSVLVTQARTGCPTGRSIHSGSRCTP